MGSFAPDFGYYIGQSSLSHFSHTLTGIFLACIPIGILLIYCLSFSGKYLAIFLPEPHRYAFQHLIAIEKIDSLKAFLILLFAVALGSLTHIIWDSFTHASGWVVVHIELLRYEIFRIRTLKIYGYSLMQHLSSIVGTVILLAVYACWLKKNNMRLFSIDAKEYWRYKLIGALIIIALVISLPIAYIHTKHLSGALAISTFVVDVAFVFIPVFFASITASVFYIRVK